jgi:NAD(P)-dependent dehydrogenase (short-subunit alcohol dehydrogenase family)
VRDAALHPAGSHDRMTLTDRVVLVTGARRIGGVVARELSARGAHLALGYWRSGSEALGVCGEIRASGRRAVAISADLSQPDACRRLVEEAASTLGRLDVLVSMASIHRPRDVSALTGEDWADALSVDLRATFLCAQAAAPHMRAAGGGRIVNVSDWTAASGRPRYRGFLSYYVAKAGVIALTEALALELAADHILVNAVAPGPIVPPPELSERERHDVVAATPVGRWGGELEVAKAVMAFIETDFITGETIRVDGGRHLR